MKTLYCFAFLVCLWVSSIAQKLLPVDTALVTARYNNKTGEASYSSRKIYFNSKTSLVIRKIRDRNGRYRMYISFNIADAFGCIEKGGRVTFMLHSGKQIECINDFESNCQGLAKITFNENDDVLDALIKFYVAKASVFCKGSYTELIFTPEKAAYFKKALTEINRIGKS